LDSADLQKIQTNLKLVATNEFLAFVDLIGNSKNLRCKCTSKSLKQEVFSLEIKV
jgi:hypothetical protein